MQTDFGDSRRLKVVRYAAAIERAYTAAPGADSAYPGRFQHNPLSDAYVTKIGRDAPYSLGELARYVDRSPVGHSAVHTVSQAHGGAFRRDVALRHSEQLEADHVFSDARRA